MLDGRAKVQKTSQRADSSLHIQQSSQAVHTAWEETIFLFYVKRRVRDYLIGEQP